MTLLTKLGETIRRRTWREFVLLAAIAGVCAGVWLFVEIADEVSEGEIQHFERDVMRSLRSPDDAARPIGPWWLNEVCRDVTALGGMTVLTVMTALVLGYLLLQRTYHAASLVLVATGGGFVLSTLLKSLFDRPRPDVVPHLTEVMTASFPSGHSMLSSVVYLTLGALLARTASRRRVKFTSFTRHCS